MFSPHKDRNQNVCFREAMTAIRKPWPGLSRMLNAIHPQGYLWRQNPFGVCLCFIFLNACIKSAELKKMKVTPTTSQMLALCAHLPYGCRVCTSLCSQWMVVIWKVHLVCAVSLCSVRFCLTTGIRQRYSKPGANTKHLNVKSVIFIPKSLNIEIRSSVQQRLVFTLIYHPHLPCTQGLISPYMVNKPLAGSRQCVMFTQRRCIYYTVRAVSQCLWHTVIHNTHVWQFEKIEQDTPVLYVGMCWCDGGLGRKREAFVCRVQASFFLPTSVCQCDIHLLEAVLHKQTTPKATTGWLNNHRLFSLFSTIAHCKFLVGPQHALLHLFNK